MELVWLLVATFLGTGLPLNTAIIWIYTKKNSRVNKSGQREFPLIFATIDLIALVIGLPLHTFLKADIVGKWSKHVAWVKLFDFVFLFVIYGYIFALITATVGKFYAVYYPFKYRLLHKTTLKVAVGLVFGLNTVIAACLIFLGLVISVPDAIVFAVYTLLYIVILVVIIVLYVLIVIKLFRNGKRFGEVSELNRMTRYETAFPGKATAGVSIVGFS